MIVAARTDRSSVHASTARPMRLRAILLAMVVLGTPVFGGRNAGAATGEPESGPISNSTTLDEEGTELYRAHDYRRAVEKFLQAYALDGDPNLLFNVARCYDALGNTDAAIEKYEAFARSAGGDPDGRTRAEAAIHRLRHPTPVSENARGGEAKRGDRVSRRTHAEAPPAQARGDLARLGRWLTLGAGVAASATGTAFLISGASDHHKVTSAPGYGDPLAVDPMSQREAQRLVDSGRTKKLVGSIFLGVGVAALATSATLFVLDTPSDELSRKDLSFQLAPDTTGATLLLKGRF